MTKNNGFKVAALAASIALAMGATSAMAADPAANALPGQGKVTFVGTGTAAAAPGTISTDGKTLTIAMTATAPGATDAFVINWGSGTDINKTGTSGFNVGSAETVAFTGAFPVLNIDSSGNPSQVFGAVTAADNIFVANSNGIIVGAGGSISTTGLTTHGVVGLIGNTTFGTNAGFAGTAASLTYNGAGGDVTVQAGSTLTGVTVIVSGGGNVNVDLGALKGATTLSAGLSQGAVPATPNASANLAITGGTLATGTIAAAGFNSAGTASNAATLDLTGTAQSVKGVFTNTGDLTLDHANTTNGKVSNLGQLDTTGGAATFASLTNAGNYDAAGITIASGGSLTNTGSITGAGVVVVNEGTINNSGSIADVTSLTTQSNSANTGFAAGGQYFINNAGTITDDGAGALTIDANKTTHSGTANDSTGSFTNTGTLKLSNGGNLTVNANNNVALGGTLQADDGTGTYKAVSKDNELGTVNLTGVKGAVTVSAPVAFATASTITGDQVKLMANVTSGTASTPTGTLSIVAGDAPTGGDYAVRVASGTTTSAATVGVTGTTKTNVILQGTVAGNALTFGGLTTPISDIISGPNGGLAAKTSVTINFNGRLKTAPYLNNANNFRYNYLPITNTGTGSLALTLNPVSYKTNGTSNGKSGVNLLVNGDVTLTDTVANTAPTSAVTGVTTWENTHLVLQSTGNITLAANTYWPGYVYLGTIDSDTSGNALPGTLSADGKITLNTTFNNVLPGDVAGASGIHFMSGNALAGGGAVTTNANAWINFPTDLLTQSYTQGLVTSPTFSAGTATGLIVNYAPFTVGQTQKLFNTHPVDATK